MIERDQRAVATATSRTPSRVSGTGRQGWRLIALPLLLALAAASCTSDDESSDSTATTNAEAAPSSAETSITRKQVEASFGDLDGIVEAAMADTGVPGVAVAVVYDDEVLYTNGYGVRSTEGDEPVDPETVFQLASLSKPVSSTVMAGLVGEEVFAWDDPIVEYAPEFELSDPWVTDHVTFEDLFSHRSGIPGAEGGNDLESIGYDRTTILERLRYLPLNPFRITYSYANFGMTLGGEAAAIADGSPWDQVAQRVLFEPAGMTSTSMNEADFRAQENRAALHVQTDGEWAQSFERHPDAQAPAGGGSSNVVDLGQWVRLQLAGGMLDGEQIIDETALDTTHTPMIMSGPPAPTIADPARFYGLGWSLQTEADGSMRWNHSGAFSTGAATAATLLPAEGLGVVVLTNGVPIGVPEAITDAYFEQLQTGAVSTDWVAVWGERFSGLLGEPQDWTTPPSLAAPARADEAYVGTYANDYVGEVQVVAGDNGLELVMGPDGMTFPLEHWDGDTFIYAHYEEVPDQRETVVFEMDAEGVATSVTISAFDGNELGTLLRISG